MSKPTSNIVIVGGSVAGLASALALEHCGRDIVILERDPPPPEVRAGDAFDAWNRVGVPQFQHAHMLFARAQVLLRERHPELLEALQREGVSCSGPDELQPWLELGVQRPSAGDTDLDYLITRRATFEYVLRRHVASLPNVRFIHGATVTGFVSEQTARAVRVRGVQYKSGARTHALAAELVIDASGKRTRLHECLRELGVQVEIERHPCEYVYMCRHYQLNDPAHSPPKARTGGVLDYLSYGIFYGEAGHFSIAMSCAAVEKTIVSALKTESGWDRLCSEIPVLARWIGESRVTSKVLGAGRFENRWVRIGTRTGRSLSGFVAVGDSHIQTNPQFGRGMTLAFLQAAELARTLAEVPRPDALAPAYYRNVRRKLRKHFDFCLASDRLFAMRAKRVRGVPLTIGERIFDYLYTYAWHPAVYSSGVIATEMLRAMHIHEPPGFFRQLVMAAHMIRGFALYQLGKVHPPPLVDGPARDTMLAIARAYGPDAAVVATPARIEGASCASSCANESGSWQPV